MEPEQVDALVAAAPDGIDFEGFEVRSDGDRYVLRAGDREKAVVDADGLANAVSAYDEYVTNWHFWTHVAPDAPARRAFLRWLEADAGPENSTVPERYDALVDGHTREWGQLAVTVTLDREDGTRRYDLRHVEDAGLDTATLDVHDDPLDARDLVKFDDRGRYRPLKTAPTLPTGWVFPDLDADELVRTVGFVYPATVENWHREREGDLDVSHWRETVERQTGIYGVVETWDRGEGHEHVNRVAEACCEDSQCLKRREWEYDGDTDLDADGGDGVFPCREPCSLVISGARQWTKLEGEEPRTYEFELTPSEKEQVEAIVESVADGRVEEIREGDFRDPANRYRARYLRAKRFEDGDLCGVPTESGNVDDEGSGPDDADGES